MTNAARHRAREAALQILYQWEISRSDPEQSIASYWAGHGAGAAPEARAFAEALVRGTVAALGEIDPLLAATAEHWRLPRMAVLDRLILRLAVFEFLHVPETPHKVAISEALQLARRFSNDDAVRFVNGVLDAVRKKLDAAGGKPEAGS
jgi:N utilization substance protein B